MPATRESAVSKHLVWAFLQAWVFMPGAFGLAFHDMRHAGWADWLLAVMLFGILGTLLVLNIARMWRAPVAEASRWHVAPLFAVGLLFSLIGVGRLLDPGQDSPVVGVIYSALALAFLTLGFREVARLRLARATSPNPHRT